MYIFSLNIKVGFKTSKFNLFQVPTKKKFAGTELICIMNNHELDLSHNQS